MEQPIFRALTRPSLKARVSIEVLALEIVITMLAVMWSGTISFLFMFIPMHAINISLFMYDPRIYTLMGNYAKHSMASVNKKVWNARSYRP